FCLLSRGQSLPGAVRAGETPGAQSPADGESRCWPPPPFSASPAGSSVLPAENRSPPGSHGCAGQNSRAGLFHSYGGRKSLPALLLKAAPGNPAAFLFRLPSFPSCIQFDFVHVSAQYFSGYPAKTVLLC